MTTRDGPFDEDQTEPIPPTTDTGDDEKPPLDTVFEALSNARRRFTLYHLTERQGEATLSELATQIAAWEDGVTPDAVESERAKRVLASLSSVHVPKLAAANFVDHDEESETVVPTERTEHIRQYLKLSERADF